MSWIVHLYWLLGWIVVGFGVVEGLAILHHRAVDTFSNSVWVWLGTFSHPVNRNMRLSVFTLFWLGLYMHFAFGWHAWPYLIVPAVPLAWLVCQSTFVWKERS